MTSPKEKAQEILRYLFINAHGDSADAIKKYQGSELPGFGIMYPQLKELAEKYNPSNEIALELITKNTREVRMISMLLTIPKSMSEEQLQLFIDNASTEELKNLLARHILAPIIQTKGYRNIEDTICTELKIKATTQYFRTQNELPEFSICIQLINHWSKLEDQNLNDGKHFAEAIYRYHHAKRNELINALKQIKASNQKLSNEITIWIEDFQYL